MKDKWFLRYLLAILIVILSFSYVFIITLVDSARSNEVILGFILGTGLTGIITFFFGSSDRKGKDDDLGDKPPPPVINPNA